MEKDFRPRPSQTPQIPLRYVTRHGGTERSREKMRVTTSRWRLCCHATPTESGLIGRSQPVWKFQLSAYPIGFGSVSRTLSLRNASLRCSRSRRGDVANALSLSDKNMTPANRHHLQCWYCGPSHRRSSRHGTIFSGLREETPFGFQAVVPSRRLSDVSVIISAPASIDTLDVACAR